MANAPLPWRLAYGGEDPTYYPSDDDMGTNTLELILRELLRPLIARWMAQRGQRVFVGADQFIYYRQFDATRRVSPDIYIHPKLRPDDAPPSIKLWEIGPPTFVLEIVSQDWEKDYFEAPVRYEQMGVRELIVYDPDWQKHPDGRRFQVFASERGKGYGRVDETCDVWIASAELGCCLREIHGPGHPLLRLATGALGDRLFPTEAEELGRQAAESARQAAESEQKASRVARAAIEDLCDVLGIDLSPERKAWLAGLGDEELATLRGQLKASRRWPG